MDSITSDNTGSCHQRHNNEMNTAWQFIAHTGMSVFLTGKAGTGKTTFLQELRSRLPKRMVVLAPTGVAAINAGGQTIHSFFQLPFGPFVPDAVSRTNTNRFRMAQQKKNLIRSLDLLVIDEISMVRADLLDQIDDALRRYRDPLKPFGGVQLLLIGDLMQLSPVAKNDEWALLSQYYATPYFFSSHALQQVPYVTIELRHIYRQHDSSFVDLLAKVRSATLNRDDVDRLNSRYIPGFSPKERDWIHLTTHNNTAREFNESQMGRLPSKPHTFSCTVRGDFPETNYPAAPQLTLKEGAQVMFIKNDPTGAHEYYNGKIGIVSRIAENFIEVTCSDSPRPIEVTPVTWENNKYTLNPDTKEITEETAGTFTQYPLRPAWAITVHKSQGLTFDKAVIDINSAFAHGQTYVALSRCRTLEGIVLTSPLRASALINDTTVNSFIDSEIGKIPENTAQLPLLKRKYLLSLLDELYSFSGINLDYEWLLRVVDEHLSRQYPKYLIRLKAVERPLHEKLIYVANRFRNLYTPVIGREDTSPQGSAMSRRITDSFAYFADTIKEIFETLITRDAVIPIENKQVATTYKNALSALTQSVLLKYALFKGLRGKEFNVSTYLDIKAKASLANDSNARPAKKSAPRIKETHTQKEKAPKKEREPKAHKTDTFQETLRLYNTGMSPDEIASARNLKPWTIYGHIAHLVANGLIDIDEVVSKEHQAIIRNAASKFTTAYTLREIRDLLPPEITYPEIKITLS